MNTLRTVITLGAISLAIARQAPAEDKKPLSHPQGNRPGIQKTEFPMHLQVIQQEVFNKHNISYNISRQYLLVKDDLSAWEIKALVDKIISPDTVAHTIKLIPSYSGYDISNLLGNQYTISDALEVRHVFPEANGANVYRLKDILNDFKLKLNYTKQFKAAIPDLTADGMRDLIRHKVTPKDITKYNAIKKANDKLSTFHISMMIARGYGPKEAKLADGFIAMAGEADYFNWIGIVSFDPDIRVSDTSPRKIQYVHFKDKHKQKFESNTTDKLPIPYELYLMVGDYGLCPTYNQQQFEDLVNEKLKASGVSQKDIAKMHPYDALNLAVKITVETYDYVNVDTPENRKKYPHHNLVQFARLGIGECQRYTQTFIGIASYFKTLNTQLKNFYFVEGETAGGIREDHSWPCIVIANKASRDRVSLKVSHIDPTFFDNGKDPLQAKRGSHYSMSAIRTSLGR